MNDSINLARLFCLAWVYKFRFLYCLVAATILISAYAIISKPQYESKALLFPKQESQNNAIFSLASLGGLMGSPMQGNPIMDKIKVMAMSDQVIGKVIKMNFTFLKQSLIDETKFLTEEDTFNGIQNQFKNKLQITTGEISPSSILITLNLSDPIQVRKILTDTLSVLTSYLAELEKQDQSEMTLQIGNELLENREDYINNAIQAQKLMENFKINSENSTLTWQVAKKAFDDKNSKLPSDRLKSTNSTMPVSIFATYLSSLNDILNKISLQLETQYHSSKINLSGFGNDFYVVQEPTPAIKVSPIFLKLAIIDMIISVGLFLLYLVWLDSKPTLKSTYDEILAPQTNCH